MYLLTDTAGDVDGLMCEFCEKEIRFNWKDSPYQHWRSFPHTDDCPYRLAQKYVAGEDKNE